MNQTLRKLFSSLDLPAFPQDYIGQTIYCSERGIGSPAQFCPWISVGGDWYPLGASFTGAFASFPLATACRRNTLAVATDSSPYATYTNNGSAWVANTVASTGAAAIMAKGNANGVAVIGNSLVTKGAAPSNWGGGGATGWQPSTAYTLTTIVQPNYFNFQNGFNYGKWVCSTGGTSGTVEPDWPWGSAFGVTVADGTAVWTWTDCAGSTPLPSLNFGYWSMAQALSGQRLNEIIVMGRSGKFSPEILSYITPRVLSNSAVGGVVFGGMFENDIVSIMAGQPNVGQGLAYIQANYAAFEAKVDEIRGSGRWVMCETVHPDAFYDASSAFTGYAAALGTRAFYWLNRKIRQMARARGDIMLIDVAPMWSDPDPTHPVWPQNTSSFLSAAGAGQQLKYTDNVHENYAAIFPHAQAVAAAITANFQPRPIFVQALDTEANTINPMNFGAGGTVSTGTGTSPNSITSAAGGTLTSAVWSQVARTDVPLAKWNQVAYVATAGGLISHSWTTAPAITFAVGSVVQGFNEIKVTASPVLIASALCVMRFPGVTDAFNQNYYPVTTDQDWGQFITADTVFTFKTLPWVVPVGATTVNLFSQVNARGAASGTFGFGQMVVAPIVVPTTA